MKSPNDPERFVREVYTGLVEYCAVILAWCPSMKKLDPTSNCVLDCSKASKFL